MLLLKEFFEKVDFEKKSADNKKHAKLPSMQKVNIKCNKMFNSIKFCFICSVQQNQINKIEQELGCLSADKPLI